MIEPVLARTETKSLHILFEAYKEWKVEPLKKTTCIVQAAHNGLRRKIAQIGNTERAPPNTWKTDCILVRELRGSKTILSPSLPSRCQFYPLRILGGVLIVRLMPTKSRHSSVFIYFVIPITVIIHSFDTQVFFLKYYLPIASSVAEYQRF